MAAKPNLVQGNPDAKRKNSPGPLSKSKRTNLAQTSVAAKAKNSPKPLAKTKAAQTYPVPKDRSDDARIHRELMTGKRNNSHSRGWVFRGSERPRYSSPVSSMGVRRAIQTTATLERSTNMALSRRMRLNEALGKFKSAAAKK